MEKDLSEILDNILGLLLLEGSYDIQEDGEGFRVEVETKDAGRLIGFKGESLSSLQLLINQALAKKTGEYKRVILDVEGWRKQKEEDLKEKALQSIERVKETGQSLELEPMPSWQRRIIHMVVSEDGTIESESVGEERERHLIIRLKSEKPNVKTEQG